ncbi:uncharacterized protein LOC124140425 [Haliotis rufescens]|uniref:uncharacterized protein LOC124140425 n=1 Tax=Haliotis rufescens TaxID=6454 RepID=UPI00201E954F|nr:uncharacterized protein LOC124140425 [Haliotis rufescens]
MSTGNPELTKETHNNSALEQEDGSEDFHDSITNDSANDSPESLVKAQSQNVEDSVEPEPDQEEQFYDVTTGLEHCKIDDVPPQDKAECSGNPLEDSSLTDDDIEVICEYMSPDVATDFKADIEAVANAMKTKTEDDYKIDDIESAPKQQTPEAAPESDQIQNGDVNLQIPPPIMFWPPECYISPSEMPRNCPIPDPNYFNPSLMFQQPPPDQVFPPHMLESQVLQEQELAKAKTCEQIESGYFPYSSGEPQSPACSSYTPSLPYSPYPNAFNGQFPVGAFDDMSGCDYSGEPSPFVYPSIYVSTSGLMTVLLKNDTSVEMTADRTVRIVSHRSKMAVASSARGNMSVLFHPSVKIFQDGGTTSVQINDVKAKMATDDIWFANERSSFKFDTNMIEPDTTTFRQMSEDESVNLLFSADTFGEKHVSQCLDAASQAEYENLPKGGVQIRINNVKITQSGRGDVIVVTGPKYLKMSPNVGIIRVNTHYIEVAVEKDLSTRIRRGGHTLTASEGQVMLSNGRIEAGFDEHSRLKVLSLPGRSPLELGERRPRKHTGSPRRATALGGMF